MQPLSCTSHCYGMRFVLNTDNCRLAKHRWYGVFSKKFLLFALVLTHGTLFTTLHCEPRTHHRETRTREQGAGNPESGRHEGVVLLRRFLECRYMVKGIHKHSLGEVLLIIILSLYIGNILWYNRILTYLFSLPNLS